MERSRWRTPIVAVSAMVMISAACSSTVEPAVRETSTAVARTTQPLATTPPVVTTLPPVTRDVEWVASDADAAIYLTWVVNDASISGSIQLANLSGDGLSVDSTPHSFEGTLIDDNFTFSVAGQVWNGVINDDQMTITYPARSGDLYQFRLVPGDISDFNTALADLRASAVSNSQAAAYSELVTGLFVDLRSASNALEELLADPERELFLDNALDFVSANASDARARAYACFELTYLIDLVAFDVESVEFEADTLERQIEDLRDRASLVRQLSDELDPHVDGEDTAWAVFAGRDVADRTDAEIAALTARIESARETARGEYESVKGLDDDC